MINTLRKLVRRSSCAHGTRIPYYQHLASGTLFLGRICVKCGDVQPPLFAGDDGWDPRKTTSWGPGA